MSNAALDLQKVLSIERNNQIVKTGTKHVISIGGGIASTLLLPLWVASRYPAHEIDLIMCRLPNEDRDVWRLCDVVQDITGLSINFIGKNLTPWDIFFKEHYLGNSQVDPCSDQLKRKETAQYVQTYYKPGEAIIYTGIGAHETDRHLRIMSAWQKRGFKTVFPLMDYPEITRERAFDFCRAFAGFLPQLYELGFEHNNCGGACIKAGHKQWARLLWYSRAGFLTTHEGIPTFDWWRDNEIIFRKMYGDYSILRDRRKELEGNFQRLPLAEFEIRMDQRWGKYLPGFVAMMEGFDLEASIADLEDQAGCNVCEAAS